MRFELGVSQLTAYDDDGFIGLQIDSLTKDKGVSPFELFGQFGFVSRPLDPDSDGTGCTVLHAQQGGRQGYAWALTDPRVVSKRPQLNKGGSAQYASDGQFLSMDPDAHVSTHYVPYEFDGSGTPTKAHVVTIGKDPNGRAIVELSSGTGLAVTLLDDVITISNADGSAWIQVDGNGTTIIGPLKAFGGADIGGPGSEPLAKAAALLEWAATVNTALAGLGATIPPLVPTVATTLTKGV